MIITSRDNSLLRRARAVRDGKAPESIFVEGLLLSQEALTSGLTIEALIYSDELARKERAAQLISALGEIAENVAEVSEKLLASISYSKTPQGIVVLAAHPPVSEANFKAAQAELPFLVLLHRVNNPVNAGAILRTAEAAGATGVIATAGSCDLFSAKAIRGSMGSAFRLSVWTEADYAEVIAWCRERGIRTIGADAAGSVDYAEVDWRGPCALVLGAESGGLSAAEIAAANEVVRIPMAGSVESLNVAVATGILLYEANRQRKSGR